MTQISFKSPGVSARVINLTGPTAIEPVGIPAGVIGTSQKGPAFVPITVPTTQDFVNIFGPPIDGAANGPLASVEWLRNRQALTYVRVLGVGQGSKRTTEGLNKGRVAGSGFVVGAQQPQAGGGLNHNPFANAGGADGRLYFLNAFMSEANGSSMLTEAGLSSEGQPLVRAVLMAPSGVIVRFSAALDNGSTNSAPGSGLVATEAASNGASIGTINLSGGRQEFVLLLNGHKGQNSLYPNAITASLDIDAPNYLGTQLNTDPLLIEEAGHLLYADYPIHPQYAVPTGSTVVDITGSSVSGPLAAGFEPILFLSTGSLTRNSGAVSSPSYENFEDRFRVAHSTWIVSQKFGGKPKNLFRIHALDDGEFANSFIKWSIENVAPSTNGVQPYGTFDLVVRSFDDFDKKKETREAFRGITLDPSSDKYIGRAVGDQHTFFNFDAAGQSQKLVSEGDYPNRSSLIRVEIASDISDGELDSSAMPLGFRGPAHLVTSGSDALSALGATETSGVLGNAATAVDPAFNVVQPPVPYRENLVIGSVTNRSTDRGLYWGVQFERKVNVSEPNATTEQYRGIKSFINYFPNFHTDFQNVVVENNEGAADSVENGILDADRFNNNLFTLENIKIQVDASNIADVRLLTSWSYVRAGGIASTGTERALTIADLTDPTVRQISKFSGILHGGFDGVRIFNKDTDVLSDLAIREEMDNTNRGVAIGATVTSYKKAISLMADDTQVDVQLLAIPGIRHEIITDDAMLKVEERFDAMLIMDVEEYDVSNTVLTGSEQDISVRFSSTQFQGRGLNSSFGAAYFPDVIIRDEVNGTTRQVPPSVAVLGAFGLNDAVAFPWYAPAGFSRGALSTSEKATIPLNRSNLDALQEVNINPLVAFGNSNGPIVWGQKTLLASDSALERVNVRRLLISLRREIRTISNRIVFEPNRVETLSRFSALVNPVMKKVQDQRGIERFLVRIDTTTTTQADIENKTIRGKIFLVPTKTLEFLSIDFNVTNQGNFVSSQ